MGSFTAFKKCSGGKIVQLLIPEKAKRSSATSRKCRAEFAKVVKIFNQDGTEAKEACSMHDEDFKYTKGKVLKPTLPFDENRWDECSSGIHFFISREEAEAY